MVPVATATSTIGYYSKQTDYPLRATVDIYGPWAMFIIDEHDRIVAHSFRPELIGQDVKTLIDSDGSAFGQAIATATEADLSGDVFGEGVKVSSFQ